MVLLLPSINCSLASVPGSYPALCWRPAERERERFGGSEESHAGRRRRREHTPGSLWLPGWQAWRPPGGWWRGWRSSRRWLQPASAASSWGEMRECLHDSTDLPAWPHPLDSTPCSHIMPIYSLQLPSAGAKRVPTFSAWSSPMWCAWHRAKKTG